MNFINILNKAEEYYKQNQLEEALRLFLKLYYFYESHVLPQKSLKDFYITIRRIAKIYNIINEPANAIFYCKKLLIICDKLKPFPFEDKINILNDLGELHEKINDYNSAIKYYNQLIVIHKENRITEGLANDYHAIADIYFKQKSYEKAKQVYLVALKFYELSDNKELTGIIYYRLGIISYLQNDYRKAMANLNSSLLVFEKLNLNDDLLNIKEEKYYKNAKKLWKKIKREGKFK